MIKLFTSPINTPGQERGPHTNYLEVTQGCSHNGCRFCSFFKKVPYRPATPEELAVRMDYLKRVDAMTPLTRIYLQGANALHLSYDELMRIAEMIHKELPSVTSIGGYGRMSDLQDKTVAQLRSMHEVGFENFDFGVETADDVLLKRVNKGYDSKLLYEQGGKFEAAGMPWAAQFILGLGGRDYGLSSAVATAEFFNYAKPTYTGIVSLTLIYDTYAHFEAPLVRDAREGRFQEAGEMERLRELRSFLQLLDYDTFVEGRHPTMPFAVAGKFPDKKNEMIRRLDEFMGQANENAMSFYRHNCVDAV